VFPAPIKLLGNVLVALAEAAVVGFPVAPALVIVVAGAPVADVRVELPEEAKVEVVVETTWETVMVRVRV